MRLKKDDVLLSSVEGSVDKIALVKENDSKIVGSTGFFVLRQNHFLPEVLVILLQVPLINELIKRQAQGTILSAIPRNSLARILLPKIDHDYQNIIFDGVNKAHNEYRTSRELFDLGTKAFEIFVETSSDAALKYINENTM